MKNKTFIVNIKDKTSLIELKNIFFFNFKKNSSKVFK